MDFVKWINSLDELLYEVSSWLIFFPLTLWRSIARPLGAMAYAEQQLALAETEQYRAALNPPLFLAIALLLAHGLTVALGQADEIVARQHGMAALIKDDASALVLRLVVFAAFPMLAATRLIRRRHAPLDRVTLRPAFYAQCYPTAILAVGLAIGTDLATMADGRARIAGGMIITATLINYIVVETRWFAAKLSANVFAAFGQVARVLVQGILVLVVVGYLLS